MADVLIREIWSNENGALSYDEENSGQRYSWIPGGVQTFPPHGLNPGDPGRMLNDTALGAPLNPAVDAFVGGPASRREHQFEIPVRGYDRLFIEWSGECVSTSGVTIDPAVLGPASTIVEWCDTLLGAAHGVGYVHPKRAHTRFPQALVRNLQEDPHNFSGFGNSQAGGGSDDIFTRAANTKRLYIRGPGINFRSLGAGRGKYMGMTNQSIVPASQYPAGSTTLAEGTLWWGYTHYDAGGVPINSPPVNGTGSRLPRAGDRYGFIIEVGWPDQCPVDYVFEPTAAGPMFDCGPLRVEHLERVYIQLVALMPAGTTGSLLFTPGPVLHVVKGTMLAILTRRSTGPRPEYIYIDRQGRVTEEDPANFQFQGRKRS